MKKELKEKIKDWINNESFQITLSDPATIERATNQLLELFAQDKEKWQKEIKILENSKKSLTNGFPFNVWIIEKPLFAYHENSCWRVGTKYRSYKLKSTKNLKILCPTKKK